MTRMLQAAKVAADETMIVPMITMQMICAKKKLKRRPAQTFVDGAAI